MGSGASSPGLKGKCWIAGSRAHGPNLHVILSTAETNNYTPIEKKKTKKMHVETLLG